MVLAVLVGVTLSANLDSSSSLAKAKRLVVVVNGCGSLAPEGGNSRLGCSHDAGVARQRSACSRTGITIFTQIHVGDVIGASLSEPHSTVARITRKLSVCVSVMDRHCPRFDVFSFDDSYL